MTCIPSLMKASLLNGGDGRTAEQIEQMSELRRNREVRTFRTPLVIALERVPRIPEVVPETQADVGHRPCAEFRRNCFPRRVGHRLPEPAILDGHVDPSAERQLCAALEEVGVGRRATEWDIDAIPSGLAVELQPPDRTPISVGGRRGLPLMKLELTEERH